MSCNSFPFFKAHREWTCTPGSSPSLGSYRKGSASGFLPISFLCVLLSQSTEGGVRSPLYLITSDPEALIGGFPPLSLRPWGNGCGPFKKKHQPSINRHLPYNSALGASCSLQSPRQVFLIRQKGCSWTGVLSQSRLFPGASSSSSISLWIFPLLLTLVEFKFAFFFFFLVIFSFPCMASFISFQVIQCGSF